MRWLLLLTMLAVTPTPATALEVGQLLRVTAEHPHGVPLHREPRNSMFTRVPDGAKGEILTVADGWIEVRFDLLPVKQGWIITKYITHGSVQDPPSEPVAPPCTYTAAPAGPAISGFWPLATPGAVLCLQPGHYAVAGQPALAPPKGLSGTVAAPIVIRPLGPVTVDGMRFDSNRHLVIDGLEVCDGDYCATWP